MTTATKPTKRTRGSPRSEAPPTLGPWVCRWIERFLVHSQGDYLGQPFRLRPWQKAFIYRAYELEPDGSRRYDRALLGVGKGNGKTELAAALALAELAGPVVFDGWERPGVPRRPVPRTAPDIPIAAASFEQADTLFGAARAMIQHGPLADFFECWDTELLPKGAPGRLYRVAAVAGTNDGRRPTFFVADELHEWEGRKERVYLVLSNGRAKRTGTWELAISTAGWDVGSLLGRLYLHGKRVQAGEVDDPRFLFQWWEAPEDLDLSDPEQLRQAVRAANPAAGDFLPEDAIVRRYYELGPTKEHEFRRYYLNQWASAPERWLPDALWAACAEDVEVPDGARIVIGFDGSYSRDSTAVVGCMLGERPHLFVIGHWERPAGAAEDWRVDIPDVEETLRAACARWDVQAIACDPFRWQRTIQVLLEAGLPMVEWPSHSAVRMAPACAAFEDAVQGRLLSHDGDERLAEHVRNCVVRIDSRGKRITKVHKDSEQKIDLAVAAVIAYDMATRHAPAPEMSWRPL
ncbi:MAG TPA: terminase TerL endonuclease subunit [Longimicrobiales bacterium]